jgi:hypothetical protein
MNHFNFVFQHKNIGKGAFGFVKKCYSKENPEDIFAVKMQSKYRVVRQGMKFVEALTNEL